MKLSTRKVSGWVKFWTHPPSFLGSVTQSVEVAPDLFRSVCGRLDTSFAEQRLTTFGSDNHVLLANYKLNSTYLTLCSISHRVSGHFITVLPCPFLQIFNEKPSESVLIYLRTYSTKWLGRNSWIMLGHEFRGVVLMAVLMTLCGMSTSGWEVERKITRTLCRFNDRINRRLPKCSVGELASHSTCPADLQLPFREFKMVLVLWILRGDLKFKEQDGFERDEEVASVGGVRVFLA